MRANPFNAPPGLREPGRTRPSPERPGSLTARDGSSVETLRIGIIVRSFPLARLTLQPWRYLTELSRAFRDAGHDVRFIVGPIDVDRWDGIPVERHEPVRDFEEAEGLQRLAARYRLDGGVCRLTANLFGSMREGGSPGKGGARLVGVFLRALPRGPDLLHRFLDPSLVPEIGMDLHHAALFLSRQRGAWRRAPRHFRRFVFLWDGDRTTGIAGGLPAESCVTLPVPFDPFYLEREIRGASPVLDEIPRATRRIVFAGPPEASRGVRDVFRLPTALARGEPTQVLVLLRDPENATVRVTTKSTGPHTVVVVRGMLSRTDQRAIYHTSQAAVFPYRWVRTGFPLVIPEAVAAGLPVVTTRVHPFRNLEGRSGLVFAERGDVRGLATALDRILSGDFTKEIAAANADWIRRTPDWSAVAQQYVDGMRS